MSQIRKEAFLSSSAEHIKKDNVIIDESTDFGKFSERHHLLIDDQFEYPRTGSDPGMILIFYQENFELEPGRKRKGGRRDVNEIITCFQRHGFNISKENVHKDLSREEICWELNRVSKLNFSDTNCLIVFFLTHGDKNENLETTDGAMLKTNSIWEKFAACETLKGKPKMFVFQACKGEGHSTGISSHENNNKINNFIPNNYSTDELDPDMLVVYSTAEGHESYRDQITGSWFIQELCKNFSSHGRRDDVVSLLIRTTKCVSGNYYTGDSNIKNKQMPLFVSTLRKKFYINRNKDRHILIQLIKSNVEILKVLTDIQEKMNDFKLSSFK